VRQRNIGKWWGQFLLSIGQISQAVSLFTLIFASIAAYPTVKVWLLDFGINIQFWQFVAGIIGTLTLGLLLAWSFGLASFFSQWNRQFWQHDNPMRLDIERLQKSIDDLAEKVEGSK